jgi:hypothetical protein
VNQRLYNCVFQGQIAEDRSIPEVKERLSKLFKADPKMIDALFDRAPVVVKRGIDEETAHRYEAAFRHAGAGLISEPADIEPTEPDEIALSKRQIPGLGWISRFLERTKSYSDLRLVVELTFIFFPLKLLIAVPLVLFGTEVPDQGLDVSLWTLFTIALAAPLAETLLGQWLPIKITSYFTTRPAVLVIVSAVLFSAAHGSVAPAILPVGLGLAWVFLIKRRESFKKAFWLTAAVHALHNFIVFGLLCLGVALDG